ncbi:MAG: hypothetical protein HY234_06385 [Acidobacteria bacterium]|nr:hypothetical protein [Acidobacteriota bacterium]MBI3662661.1 hypothetical protein [Acidobacteriota bacterium]
MRPALARLRFVAFLLGACLLALVFLGTPLRADKANVISSVHNLSASGPGSVTSQQPQVCIFCHTPHSSLVAEKPLWNHQLSIQSYSLYASSTLNASLLQPGQISKQCLSCHDGTVALGQTVANGLIPTQGTPRPSAVLGTDLRNDHPITFALVDDGQLVPSLLQSPPSTGDPAVLLQNNWIECVTCHDPHVPDRDPVVHKFLTRSNANGSICLACHDPSRPQPNRLNGWSQGAHRNSTNATPVGPGFGAYGTVAANACLNCHLPHGAPTGASARLLRGTEEAACSGCHSGGSLSPALRNLFAEFNKIYAHPVATLSGLHDAAENAAPLSANRHAECADCHNSHAASNTGGTTIPPGVQAALLGASGADGATGVMLLQPASKQYEICFKCHANSSNKPQAVSGYATYGRTARRVTDNTVADPYNTRIEFNSTFARHPVTQPRFKSSATIPSLRLSLLKLDGSVGRSLSSGTYLHCTDCHTNNAARDSGGPGPNGVHASTWPHLLERRYEQEVPPATPGSNSAGIAYVAGLNGTYALCYKCHDIDNSILQNRSFKEHDKHVRSENAPCSTCHDPHGIQGGSSTNNYNSINFDLAVVGASSSGILRFERTGSFSGRCYLRCHGQDHNPQNY